MMVMKNIFVLVLSHLFISQIYLLYTVFTQYVYACDISYYPIMTFIINLYLFISICYLLVRYLYCLYFVDVSDCLKHLFKHINIPSSTKGEHMILNYSSVNGRAFLWLDLNIQQTTILTALITLTTLSIICNMVKSSLI